MAEKIFAKGFYFDRPREGAPEYVRGQVSIKVADAVPFLQEHVNEHGYVRLDLLLSREENKPYFSLNTWKPAPKAEPQIDDLAF